MILVGLLGLISKASFATLHFDPKIIMESHRAFAYSEMHYIQLNMQYCSASMPIKAVIHTVSHAGHMFNISNLISQKWQLLYEVTPGLTSTKGFVLFVC